jgi:hypothetical protein
VICARARALAPCPAPWDLPASVSVMLASLPRGRAPFK